MEKKWMVSLCIIFLGAVIICCTKGTAKSKTEVWNYDESVEVSSEAFTYHAYISQDETECWIYRIDIDTSEGSVSKLEIPSKIKDIKVTRIGYTDGSSDSDQDQDMNLFGVAIDQTKEDGEYTKITSVILPDALSHFDTDALVGCSGLEFLSLSSDNDSYKVTDDMLLSGDGTKLLYVVPKKTTVEIPEGVTTIETSAFLQSKAKAVMIPSTVSAIGAKAFENENIKKIEISNENESFAISGQCIYKKSDNSLCVALPNTKGYLRISNRICKLDSSYSIAGGEVKVLILSKNLEEVEGSGFDFGRGDTLDKVYFTGAELPELTNIEDVDQVLPISTDIYVLRNSISDYEEWYKENDSYDLIDNWETYTQSDLKKVEQKI